MTRQIGPLIVVHGLAMFSWIILFCLQSTLILIGNRWFLIGYAAPSTSST
jgi:hypothetical protein